jgi:hypothetical protein
MLIPVRMQPPHQLQSAQLLSFCAAAGKWRRCSAGGMAGSCNNNGCCRQLICKCMQPAGRPDAVPLLGWQLAAQLHQMPAAQSKQAALSARWHQRISSAHGTHMENTLASADHAAGRVPVSLLFSRYLHSFGVRRTQGECQAQPQRRIRVCPPMICMVTSMMWQRCLLCALLTAAAMCAAGALLQASAG